MPLLVTVINFRNVTAKILPCRANRPETKEGQWDGHDAPQLGDKHGNRLAGVAHDVGGLGVGFGLLVKRLDRGHLSS